MKKLDKLIIKAFIGPFVATFFITLFVLIMQFFWLYIDDFVGKGLDAGTIFKFIWYQGAVLIPLALPLSLLLSSLMTFGNLGESFELVAIKSAGISLLRFMRPLFAVTAVIAFGAFLFSNYVMPVATLKSRTLLGDIVYAKPAFAIKEGVFFDGINKVAIKIGKKEPNDSIIRDVIVYQAENVGGLQDAFLVAQDGVMRPSPDKRFLDIVFKNGWRYEEKGVRGDSSTEYVRLGFKEYKVQMDISDLKFSKSDDSANANNERMYNMRQLNLSIDSIEKYNDQFKKNFELGLYFNFSVLQYVDSTAPQKIADSLLNFKANIDAYMGIKRGSTQAEKDAAKAKMKADSIRKKFIADSIKLKTKRDSGLLKRAQKRAERNRIRGSLKLSMNQDTSLPKVADSTKDTSKNKKTDTLSRVSPSGKNSDKDSLTKLRNAKAKSVKKDPNSFAALMPDSARQLVEDKALGIVENLKTNLEMNVNSILDQEKNLQRYKIEWHRKIALALACMVLFMIGAPLGSIIRKGGLGTPMIFAIIFFMIFYFVSTRGEKLAKELQMSAFSGMWLSTFVLVPVGLFLTYKAMHDSNLFNKEFYSRLKRKIVKKLGDFKEELYKRLKRKGLKKLKSTK